MKNMLRKLIAATAICALCAVTALPASAADGTALTLDQFVSLARLVFNQADPADAIAKMDSVVSKTVEKTGSVDEIAAALAAAVVAREDADVVLLHLASGVGNQHMPVVQRDAEARVGQHFVDHALHLNQLFFGHIGDVFMEKNAARRALAKRAACTKSGGL